MTMIPKGALYKLSWFIGVVTVVVVVHHFVLRPWFLDWGAPSEIRSLSLPGDQFTTARGHTRAVLIQAKPQEIWPWIVQLGQDRGGMYSYAWLENLVRADIHNVYELQEDLQQPRSTGDTVWLANRERYGGQGYQVLAMVVPNSAFVMVGGEDYGRILHGEKARGSWAIYLHPENEHFTWLIARSTGGDFPAANRIFRYFTYEVPHFIMEKRMLKTMKRLAEQ
jgi:hypothetical protein